MSTRKQRAYKTKDILVDPEQTISNVPWLISLALDCADPKQGHPPKLAVIEH